MSIQESKLTAIADAIRYAESSTELIPAPAFPDRIRALKSGGGGSGGGIVVLEDWLYDKEIFVGHITLAEMSLSTYSMTVEVLEGYL